MDSHYKAYVDSILRRGELYYELARIRRLLVHHESHPLPNREDHAKNIRVLTAMFKALLLTKETRQEVVQNVCQDNCGDTENGSPCPTDDSRSCVRVGDVLKEKIARS